MTPHHCNSQSENVTCAAVCSLLRGKVLRKRSKHEKRQSFVLSPLRCLSHMSAPEVSTVWRNRIWLAAHSTAYKLEDYPGPACGYSVRCGQVYGCLWEMMGGLYTGSLCVNNLVQPSALGCESLTERRLSLSSWLTYGLLSSTWPVGFMGFRITLPDPKTGV